MNRNAAHIAAPDLSYLSGNHLAEARQAIAGGQPTAGFGYGFMDFAAPRVAPSRNAMVQLQNIAKDQVRAYRPSRRNMFFGDWNKAPEGFSQAGLPFERWGGNYVWSIPPKRLPDRISGTRPQRPPQPPVRPPIRPPGHGMQGGPLRPDRPYGRLENIYEPWSR